MKPTQFKKMAEVLGLDPEMDLMDIMEVFTGDNLEELDFETLFMMQQAVIAAMKRKTGVY